MHGGPTTGRAWLPRLHPGVLYAVLAPTLGLASAATGMLIPMMLSPVDFGAYTMVVGIFQVCVVFDLGLGQLMDRVMAKVEAGSAGAWPRAAALLWLRLGVALLLVAATVATAVVAAWQSHGDLVLTGVLSAFAGVAFMMANGMVSYYRAVSRYRDFTALAVYLQVGLIVPRLAGILVAGSIGCFVALALWYGAAASGVARLLMRARAAMPSRSAAAALVAAALPLFISTLLWTLYLTANRWLSALVSDAAQLGYFSFAANLAFLLVGSVATVAQVYYPRVSRQIADGDGRPWQVAVAMAALAGGVGLAVVVADIILEPLTAALFPAFLPALAASRFMLVAAVPLSLASCLLPLLLAISRASWADGLCIFVCAFAALAAGMLWAGRGGDIVGQALGCLPGALLLLLLLLWRLARAGGLTARPAAAVYLITLAVVAGALLVAWRLR